LLSNGAFDRSDLICGYNGCSLELQEHTRANRNQPYYYRCVGSLTGSLDVAGSGHSGHHIEAVTRNSLFYRRKTLTNYTYSAIKSYFCGVQPATIWNTHSMSRGNLAQLFRDAQVLMFSDYHRYHGDYLLGSDRNCHHIQIDESKFGKRKNHRGHRVEGVWVFGMVECLETGQSYRYVNNDEGIDELRPKYKAGRKFFCTVPNRSAATLLPIIYRYCARGTIIRSDGWAAYSGLHPRSRLDSEGNVLENTVDYDEGGFHFRAHQVVNHSLNFATTDQVRGNRGITGIPSSGRLHTNMIESFWRPLKEFIKPRNRNPEDCPGKLMEYLWRDVNKHDLEAAIHRALREVSFDPNNPANLVTEFIPELITRGEDGNTMEENERRAEREAARFDRWLARRRVRDIEDVAFQQENESEAEGDDAEDEAYMTTLSPTFPTIARQTRSQAARQRQVATLSIASFSTPLVVSHHPRTARNPRGAGRPPAATRTHGVRSSSRRRSRR
jgi:hypothetical protein